MNAAKESNRDADEFRMGGAYDELLDEIQSVPDAELIHINIDIPTAVTTVLGTLPEIRALRPQIKAELKGVDLARFDKLERYADALFHAHTLYVTSLKPVEPLAELVAEATRVRDMLYMDAMALAHRGLLDAQQLRDVKTGPGYRPLAVDLSSMVAVFRATWDTLKAKTAVSPSELALAESLAKRLLNAIGQRETQNVAEVAAIRQRAFSLFVRTYDQMRKVVSFLRWDVGDAERIAPSLYASRMARKKGEREPAEGAEEPTPSTSTGNAKPGDEAKPADSSKPSDGEKPTGGAKPAATNEPAAASPAAPPEASEEVGLPDSEPFAAL